MRPPKRTASSIIEDIEKRVTRPNALDPQLVPTDRLMERWGVSVGSGLSKEDPGDAPLSIVSQLDDGTAVTIDRIVQALPWKYKQLAVRWYRSSLPRSEIARELRLPRTSLYLEWRSMLWYLRGRFHGAGIDC